MLNPTTALAWEFWQRNRRRLITVAAIVAGFALFYPKLCARAGINLNAPEIMDELIKQINRTKIDGSPSLAQIIQILYVMALACAPAVGMLLTLLYTTWLFTFTSFDPKTKDPLKFPERLFTLPVSTPFLYWRLMPGGMMGIVILFLAWHFFVRVPQIENFTVFQNCFLWATLLAMSQGIIWSLAAWPITRTLILTGLLFGFCYVPGWHEHVPEAAILPPVFVLGLVLAWAGLEKMRHGQWQGWVGMLPPGLGPASRAQLPGPKQFSSAARAQLWFEWRRLGRPLSLTIGVLGLGAMLAHVIIRYALGWGPLQTDTMAFFAGYLLGMPLLIYFCVSLSPNKTDFSFTLLRPMATGQFVMVELRAIAASVMISYALCLLGMICLFLLGDFPAVERAVSSFFLGRFVVVLIIIFAAWRVQAVNLCFVLTGRRRIAEIAFWLFILAGMCAAILWWLSTHDDYWAAFARVLPALLGGLLVVKFTLAMAGFGLSLKRQLLDVAQVSAYIATWILLAGAGLVTLEVMTKFYPASNISVPTVALLIALAVPLARIGFAPLGLAMNRHT